MEGADGAGCCGPSLCIGISVGRRSVHLVSKILNSLTFAQAEGPTYGLDQEIQMLAKRSSSPTVGAQLGGAHTELVGFSLG